jgi:ribosome assembly protein 1
MSPPKDPNFPRGTVAAITPSKQITVKIHVRPLPAAVTEFLIRISSSVKAIYSTKREAEWEEVAADMGGISNQADNSHRAKMKFLEINEIRQGLQIAFNTAPPKERDVWAGVLDKIVAFGPRRIGPNILLDATDDCRFRKL